MLSQNNNFDQPPLNFKFLPKPINTVIIIWRKGNGMRFKKEMPNEENHPVVDFVCRTRTFR